MSSDNETAQEATSIESIANSVEVTQEKSTEQQTQGYIEESVTGSQLEEQEWYLAEGVKGEGPKPDWFDSDKYKYVMDQAKGLPGMRKELSKLPGAPESYSLEGLEELSNIGVDFEGDTFKSFTKMAKENRLNQDTFNHILGFYKDYVQEAKAAQEQELKDFRSKQIEKLGPTAEEDISSLVTWANNTFPESLIDSFKSSLTTADSVKVLNFLRNKMVNDSNVTNIDAKLSQDDYKLQLEQKIADPRWIKDPDFTRHVENLFKKQYG